MSRSQQQPKREPIQDKNFVMPFGRYKGETLGDVLEVNSAYILWLHENTDMDFHYTIIEEAETIPVTIGA